MSGEQEGVIRSKRAVWNPTRDFNLLQLFIEQHNCGRTPYNEYRNEVIKSVTRVFNWKFGSNLEERQIINRYNAMKKDYGIIKTLLSHPGFDWDQKGRRVVADDKVWDSYIAIRSEARVIRRKLVTFYDEFSILFEGERTIGKQQFPTGVPLLAEETNSNTETVKSSEPTNVPVQVFDGALHSCSDSYSMIPIDHSQHKKHKSKAPAMSGHKRRQCNKDREAIENALYEMFFASNTKAVQKNSLNEKTLYHSCLEELQKIEELDDMEFTKAVDVLKDDKNAVAFKTIKGPRRLVWLRSQWQD
ncbi:hypothetical protein UlMin_030915 [Ulmus minor]